MTPLRVALDFILKQEGGYVNDAVDLGGVTNHGISFRFLKSLAPELADIDGDGDIDAEDVAAMTPAAAEMIYEKEFWEKMGLAMLPGPVAIAMMDTAVNMGPAGATRILQKTVHDIGAGIKIDGILGTNTVFLAAAFGNDHEFIPQFLLNRIWRYQEIVLANRKLAKFLNGWLCRVFALNALLRKAR
ncbi:MAG: glycosyl hydrolase 108 family protein [Desulfobacterales bacterium]|jgi:lysozyme family protein|nr:glycosyl hydrolase 108 family protein [Desulfobacterales bacterium]